MIVHVDQDEPTNVGEDVTVGHAAIIHAATIAPRVLIGMQAVILSGVTIGEGCIIGAAALVPEGRTIPPRSLVLGTPGRVVREVTDAEYEAILHSAEHYASLARAHRALPRLIAEGNREHASGHGGLVPPGKSPLTVQAFGEEAQQPRREERRVAERIVEGIANPEVGRRARHRPQSRSPPA